jgi:hypothetical protein
LKLRLALRQAMAIVQDRLNANKPQPPPNDPKKALNNNKDLDVDIKKEDQSFFGSFFAKAKGGPPAKKGAAAMDAVSHSSYFYSGAVANTRQYTLAAACHPSSGSTQ